MQFVREEADLSHDIVNLLVMDLELPGPFLEPSIELKVLSKGSMAEELVSGFWCSLSGPIIPCSCMLH